MPRAQSVFDVSHNEESNLRAMKGQSMFNIDATSGGESAPVPKPRPRNLASGSTSFDLDSGSKMSSSASKSPPLLPNRSPATTPGEAKKDGGELNSRDPTYVPPTTRSTVWYVHDVTAPSRPAPVPQKTTSPSASVAKQAPAAAPTAMQAPLIPTPAPAPVIPARPGLTKQASTPDSDTKSPTNGFTPLTSPAGIKTDGPAIPARRSTPATPSTTPTGGPPPPIPPRRDVN